ncbi:MAG: response regulator, partial [Myxococcaceae bacterium]|nr:response regulator [Myxococcaceae bacterium]
MSETVVPPPRPRLLIIDDDPRFLTAISRMLKTDYRVSTEADSTKVLSRLQIEEPFELVLCDMTMPDLDGPEVHRVVSESLPEYLSRLVFFTGGAVTASAQAFLRRSDVTHISKYLSPAALKDEVAK